MQSYSYFMSATGNENGHYVELSENKFHELLKCLLVQVEVDEDWYRATYHDVDDAVRAKIIPSGKHHYMSSGYFENRFPRPIEVDETWYLDTYPDVAAAIDYGSFTSAAQHFERDGFKEGRLPQRDWSLLGAPARQMAFAE